MRLIIIIMFLIILLLLKIITNQKKEIKELKKRNVIYLKHKESWVKALQAWQSGETIQIDYGEKYRYTISGNWDSFYSRELTKELLNGHWKII